MGRRFNPGPRYLAVFVVRERCFRSVHSSVRFHLADWPFREIEEESLLGCGFGRDLEHFGIHQVDRPPAGGVSIDDDFVALAQGRGRRGE